ncbi:MAG TPA: hypothetical protein VMC08_05265 [Bacteroidales bacterium]|nr:hypothetical protein [Bacteroidales bacterium]
MKMHALVWWGALTGILLGPMPLTAQKSEAGPGGIRRIGYLEPDSLAKLKKIYPKTAFMQKGTVEYAFNLYAIDTVGLVKGTLGFDQPDAGEIISLCKENNLDALMLTRLNFLYQKLHNYYQAEVELKLYDRQGNLISNPKCNTLHGKSYYPNPELFEVERDVLNCAIGKIAKDLKLKKKK